MAYRVVYDIANDPAIDWMVASLSGAFMLVGITWRLVQRSRDKRLLDPPKRPRWSTPNVLWGFGLVMALIGVGLMGWDHWRLMKAIRNGEAQVVEGPVQSYGTERQRTANTKRREYRTYERFYIGDSIWFGYHWDAAQAGFYNGQQPRVEFKDGMLVRAQYLYADGADDPPRIVKLEVME